MRAATVTKAVAVVAARTQTRPDRPGTGTGMGKGTKIRSGAQRLRTLGLLRRQSPRRARTDRVGDLSAQTARPTGRAYQARFALHLTVVDGLVTRHHVYEDSLAVAQAFEAKSQ
ncbi:nuclear transport factor 2 family protein [Streptomyces sp. NPDC059398]|uniref:nuclear transport factor 2 family protein n=1 Tax=Streptomyces sp. NPDC059398 TaxID=3346820 RepID=UPI00369C803A